MRRPSLLLVTAAAARPRRVHQLRRRRAPRPRPTAQELTGQGGDATVDIAGSGAFAQPVPGLDGEQRRTFAVGNNFFNDNWVTAPASTDRAGRPRPAVQRAVVLVVPLPRRPRPAARGRRRPRARPAVPARACSTPTARPSPTALLGGQLQDQAIRGVPVEGSVVITRHRGARRVPRRHPVLARSCRPTRCSTSDGEPVDGPARLAADRAGGVRRRPARGGAGRRHPRRSPTPTTPTATASRAGPTSCPTRTSRTASRCSGASAGRPRCRASRSRTRAPSSATSASPRRCAPTSPARASRPSA